MTIQGSTSWLGRKRAFPHSSLLMASAIALSMSCAAAFQSSLTPTAKGAFVRSRGHATRLCVVTDPKQLMLMDISERDNQSDRNALEDIYLISTRDDGLFADLVEGSSKELHVKRSNSAAKIKKTSMQFRGLSTTPKSRAKGEESFTGNTPTAKGETLSKERQRIPSTRVRSSTMPGFRERSNTDRQRAFRNGIKLAEQRTGKKFVETEEKKKKRRKANGEMMYKTSASVPESLVQFAGEIHEIDRITPKEEKILGEKTQEAIRLQTIYDGLESKLSREPTDEEWCAASGKINMEAISQTIEEGLEAKNKLVTSNLRMVQGVVNVYIRNGLRGQYNAGDLMQEGIMALIRAAEKFDPGRGFRFSTYAMYWIRSSIKRNQIYQSRVVSIPQRLYENHKRINRVKMELTDSLDRPPTKKELSDAVGMSEVQIDRCLSAMSQRCYSLDQQISNPFKPNNVGDQDTMYELVASRTDDGDYNNLKHIFLREDLMDALHRHLSEEEATLLLLRYGMMDSVSQSLKNGPLTIAEVSRIVGLKPDKVRRMINKSLKHLKGVIGDEWRGYDRDFS